MRYTFIAIYNAWFDTIHPFSTHHPYSFISFHFLNYESTPRYRAVTYYYFMNFVKLPIHSMALYRVTSKYSKVISNVISYSCLWKSYTLNFWIYRYTFIKRCYILQVHRMMWRIWSRRLAWCTFSILKHGCIMTIPP